MTASLTPKSSATIEDLLRMAKEDLSRSALSSAEKNLELAILQNNQNPEAFYLLGSVYQKRGKFKKAILAFQRTLTLDSTHTEAAIALSSLYNDVGKYKEGAVVYQGAKSRLDHTQPGHDPKINQQLTQKHYELGMMYSRFERFQEAYQEFTKALNLDPDNVFSSFQIAKCLGKTGDKEGAVQRFKKILEKYPRNVDAKVQLGVMYHSLQRYSEAHSEWKEAYEIDPENKMTKMYLSMIEEKPITAGFVGKSEVLEIEN